MTTQAHMAARGGAASTLRAILVALAFTVVVVLLLLWLAGFFHHKLDTAGGHGPIERPVGGTPLATVTAVRLPQIELAVGTVRAVHETAIASKLLAKVLAVNVQAGQLVKAGEVLVQLDDADLQAQLRQSAAAVTAAEAALANAQVEFDRIRQLYEQSNETKSAFDRAETTLKMAAAELERARQAHEQARTTLEYATIRSPIDGRVIERRVEVGDMARPGEPLVSLYDPDRMQLVASVRESLSQRLAVGQTIGVRVDALGHTCQGRISEIVPEAESASRTFQVKVTGPCPPGVYSGMFGRLLIPLDEQEVLLIPPAAVRRVGQLDLVDVVEAGAAGPVLRRRVVQVGRTLEGQVEVLAGLRAGEQVALPT